MDNIILISGCIVLVGLIIFLILVFKAKRKHNAIKHYEKIRDELTLDERKVKEEELGYEKYSGMSVRNIIGGFVAILVGVSLIKPITEEMNLVVEQQSNLTSASEQILSPTMMKMLDVVPIFFVIALLFVVIGIVSNSLRRSGLL